MDLTKLTPIVERVFKEVLSENRYPFGNPTPKGLSNKIASGKLVNSIKAIQTKPDTIVVYGPEGKPLNETYGDWGGKGDVNLGRKANLQKGPPISALEKWIKDKGLTGRDKKGRFIKTRSFAFAIQTNIKKFGIRPTNFVEIALDRIESDAKLVRELELITIDEITQIIEGI